MVLQSKDIDRDFRNKYATKTKKFCFVVKAEVETKEVRDIYILGQYWLARV